MCSTAVQLESGVSQCPAYNINTCLLINMPLSKLAQMHWYHLTGFLSCLSTGHHNNGTLTGIPREL